MIRKMLESIVRRSEDTQEDEIVEKGFFIFEGADGNILAPYELKESDDPMKERDRIAAEIYGKEVN